MFVLVVDIVYVTQSRASEGCSASLPFKPHPRVLSRHFFAAGATPAAAQQLQPRVVTALLSCHTCTASAQPQGARPLFGTTQQVQLSASCSLKPPACALSHLLPRDAWSMHSHLVTALGPSRARNPSVHTTISFLSLSPSAFCASRGHGTAVGVHCSVAVAMQNLKPRQATSSACCTTV